MKLDSSYCGFGKTVFLKPPYWYFQDASCKIHDDNYKKGGTKEDRLKADVGFLKYMILDARYLPYKQKRKAVLWACIYYMFVRAFGWVTFRWKI